MNTRSRYNPALVGFLILFMAVPLRVIGQGSGTSSTFRQEELGQMLAPIALYPDSLLAQVLMAAVGVDFLVPCLPVAGVFLPVALLEVG